MKTRFIEWHWNEPSTQENHGHTQSEWGLKIKKNQKNS